MFIPCPETHREVVASSDSLLGQSRVQEPGSRSLQQSKHRWTQLPLAQSRSHGLPAMPPRGCGGGGQRDGDHLASAPVPLHPPSTLSACVVWSSTPLARAHLFQMPQVSIAAERFHFAFEHQPMTGHLSATVHRGLLDIGLTPGQPHSGSLPSQCHRAELSPNALSVAIGAALVAQPAQAHALSHCYALSHCRLCPPDPSKICNCGT